MKLIQWLKDEINTLTEGKIVGWQVDAWGDIFVIDHGRLRVLTFDSIHEQSRLDKKQPTLLKHNYTQAMMLGLAFINPKHITLLGLGGGCLLRALHSSFSTVNIEVVELRQAVVDIATTYFVLPRSRYVKINVIDAKKYLKSQETASSDLIFADMFHAWGIDEFQTQRMFLVECQRVLNDNGWLIINYHDRPDPDSQLFKWMKEYYEEVLICPVPRGNYVIYLGKCQLTMPLASYFKNIKLQNDTNTRYEQLFGRLKRFDGETKLYQMIR